MKRGYAGASSSATSMRDGIAQPQRRRREGASRWINLTITGTVLLGLAALVFWFFRADRSNDISRWILSLGTWSVLLAVLLMAVLSILPVPSEFLMIVLMKIYGPWWGMLYSWVGTLLAAVATFLLARHFGQRLLRMFISNRRMEQVSHWIGDRGITGLLLARIVPLPFIVVNYTAGISEQVTLWNYTWTSAVGGIPYYVGAALVFLGASRRYLTWLVVGGIAVIAIWAAGYVYNRHVQTLKRWAH